MREHVPLPVNQGKAGIVRAFLNSDGQAEQIVMRLFGLL